EIHAPVFLKMLVFGGENRVFQDLRILLVGEQHAALQREIADNLAVVRIEFRDHIGLEILKRANLRKIAGANKQQAGEAADRNRGQEQQRKGDPPDNLAAAQTQRNRRQLYHGSNIL